MNIRRTTCIAISLGLMSSFSAAADDETDGRTLLSLEPTLIDDLNAALPERQVANQEYLDFNYNPNIQLQSESQIGVTFLLEGAGYKNSLGYFTFEDDTFTGTSFSDFDTDGSGNVGIQELNSVAGINAGMIFENSSALGSGGVLQAGDTVVLGGGTASLDASGDLLMSGGTTFAEDTNVGFFLIQNAYQASTDTVKGWDTNQDPLTFYSVDFLNPENTATANLDSFDLNSRHVAMMTDSTDSGVILGFEDLRRPYGDNDFNDSVFLIRTDPVSALTANVPTVETVISLNAAPMGALGNGLVSLFALLLFTFSSPKLRQQKLHAILNKVSIRVA